jgi:hypothetical protein
MCLPVCFSLSGQVEKFPTSKAHATEVGVYFAHRSLGRIEVSEFHKIRQSHNARRRSIVLQAAPVQSPG